MILGVEITNFDVFENERLGILIEDSVAKAGEEAKKSIRLRSLNALIGRNNTGKTSFLMALSFIKRSLNQGVAIASTTDGRPGFSNLIIDKSLPAVFKLFFRLRDINTGKSKFIQYELAISVTDYGSPCIVSECVRISNKNGEEISIDEILSLHNGEGFVVDPSGNRTDTEVEDYHLTALSIYGKLNSYTSLRQLYKEIDSWFFCRFSSEISNKYYMDGNAPGGHRHLSSSGSNVNNVLEYIEQKDPDYYDRIITEITEKIPQMKKKKTLPNNLDSSPDKLFLYLLLLRDQNPHTTIFIETPDKDLYHDMVDVLSDEMRDFVLNHPYNQIIFTTHNPYIIESMSPGEIWVFNRDFDDEDMTVNISCAGSDPVVSSLFKEGVGMGAIWYGGHLDAMNSGDN